MWMPPLSKFLRAHLIKKEMHLAAVRELDFTLPGPMKAFLS
jgi:hypothetical protein